MLYKNSILGTFKYFSLEVMNMEEELYARRFQNLEESVKKGLKQMQTDGLARQLEMHRSSAAFAPNRLLEVLSDNIESSREKFIQQLLHEIDNAVFDRDKIELKAQKYKAQMVANQKAIQEENKNLKQLGDSLVTYIKKVQKKQADRETKYTSAIARRDTELRNSRKIFETTKSILDSLSSDLSNLRIHCSQTAVSSQRNLRTSCNQIKLQSNRYLTQINEDQKAKATSEMESKENLLKTLKKKTTSLQNAYNSITSYLNKIAATSSISRTISDPQSLSALLTDILEAKGNEAVKLHLRESRNKINGISLDKSHYCESISNYVNEELRKKDKELDEIIKKAHNRRRQLEKDINDANEKIKKLQESGMSAGNDSMRELEQSELLHQSAMRELDLTMSQLDLPSSTRRKRDTD